MSSALNGKKANFQVIPEEASVIIQNTFFDENSELYQNEKLLIDWLAKYQSTNGQYFLELTKILFEKLMALPWLDLDYLKTIHSKLDERGNIGLNQKIIFLKKLWNEGDLKTYFEQANKALDEFVILKNYESIMKICSEITQITPLWLKPYFVLIFAHINSKNFNDVQKQVSLLSTMLSEQWDKLENRLHSRIEYYEKVIKILEPCIDENIIVLKSYLLFKLRLFHATNAKAFKFSKEEVLKFMICFSNEFIEIAGILPILKNNLVQQSILKLVKNKIKISDISRPYPLSAKFLMSRTFQMQEIEQEEQNLDVDVRVEYYQEYKGDEDQIYEKYLSDLKKETDDEFKMISRIRSGEFEDIENKLELFYAFKSMGFFKAAELMLQKKSNDTNELYLYCELLLEQEKYIECLTEIDTKVIEKVLSDKLSLEFKYLKAEALRNLGKTTQAKVLYREIASANPDFRLVRERIRDA